MYGIVISKLNEQQELYQVLSLIAYVIWELVQSNHICEAEIHCFLP